MPHPINLHIGKIVGGDRASSVPAWCRFDIHRFDERFSLASFKAITGVTALFVAVWCGMEAVDGPAGS